MSQLAQDDDGNFEIASLGGSLDDELEDGVTHHHGYSGISVESGHRKNDLPRGALHEHGRHSLDGETIFAIGEDGDKMSDDEDDHDGNEQYSRDVTKRLTT